MQKTAYLLFYTTLFLIAVGLVMIYSTSAILAQERFGDALFFLRKELLWVAFGVVTLYVGYRVPYEFWGSASLWILILSAILLVGVMVPSVGHQVGGARRWLKVGGFSFQPSELAKYATIFFLAKRLSSGQNRVKSFVHGFLPPIAVLGLMVVMILIQPDLGTTLGIGTVGMILLFVGGVRFTYLLGLTLISLPALYYLIAGAAYRRARILAFLDPWKDPKGVGFQIIQSFIALGSGGLTGVGLGESRQKLFYLPEAHTDFIFSIIGEELGFLGVLMVCLAFFFLFVLGFRVVLKTEDLLGHLMGLGIVSLLAFQTVINMGVVTGTLPTKGLPLPFISFGGTSLVLNMAGIGILMNLAGRLDQRRNRDSRESLRVRVKAKPRRLFARRRKT
ncbi:MAG: putative lipid II flippase FtsW [Chlamydiae bacterium]|nr:putative lipid II flippase FtsW [Chlamydiota bacterium]MBI3267010.1 putative lipid II flippase FtsW [Chlamydiota bacterium]